MRPLLSLILAVLAMSSEARAYAVQDAEENPNRAIVTPIFTERPIRVQRPRDVFKGWLAAVDKTIPVISFGSGFLYSGADFHAIVTAAHVVEFPPDVNQVDNANGAFAKDDGFTLDLQPARIRISGLSVRPSRVLVDHKLDIAVLQLDGETVELLELRPLHPGKAMVNQEAKLWGFPGIPGAVINGVPAANAPSASQTSQRCDITDVRKGEVICTALNGIETRGGFSGGPLIDAEGAALGMISRSTPETTRCRSIEAIDGVIARFAKESRPYSE